MIILKKYLIFTILLIICLIPNNTYAIGIKDTQISGNSEVLVGDTLKINFQISLTNDLIGKDSNYGIYYIAYELNFDDTIFVPTEVSSNGFDSIIFKDTDGTYYGYSEISGETTSNTCKDGYLYCGTYYVDISFITKNTDESSSRISIGEISIGVIDITNLPVSYDIDNTHDINGISDKVHKIKITQNKTNTDVSINDITTAITKDKQEIINNDKTKSTNTYLKSLEIKDYKINFYKKVKNYTITIPKDINKLDNTAIPEEENATYQIIGADNLKENNYQVLIEVTNQGNLKTTYKIDVLLEEEPKKSFLSILSDKLSKIIKNKTYRTILFVSLGVIFLIIITISIISKRKYNKISKMLDEL